MPTLHKLTIGVLFGAALLLATLPVYPGQFYAGNTLLEICKGTAPGEASPVSIYHGSCMGYLAGVADAEATWVKWGAKAQTFCVPNGTNVEQLRQVFLRWMDQHPEHWHLASGDLMITAFREAWPCAD